MNEKALAVAATLADGSLAGSNIDRMVMEWPVGDPTYVPQLK